MRKIFDIDNDPDVLHTTPAELGGKTLGDALLAPTKIYVKPVLKVLEEVDVKGISHITGGGFYENIPRSLKKGCCARIKKEDVRIPALFHLMQETGHISEHDMFNTFNMGVGMVLTVPAAQPTRRWRSSTPTASPRLTSWVSSLKGTVWNCAERSCVGFRRRHQSAGPAGQRSPGREPQRKITLVVASKPGVYALERAAKAGVEGVVVRRKDYENSEAFDAALLETLKSHNIDLVVLAGFLSVLGPSVIEATPAAS